MGRGPYATPPGLFSDMALGGRGELPYPLQWLRMGSVGEGLRLCSEWGVVPHPLSTGARGWQGLPRLSTQLSPVRVRLQLQGWLLWGQFPPLVFGRTSRAGPGRQRDSRSGCGAGLHGHVLAGAAAVPGRVVFSPPATTRLSDYPRGHLKVLRMGPRKGWILGLSTPFS